MKKAFFSLPFYLKFYRKNPINPKSYLKKMQSLSPSSSQITSTVLMVYPRDFTFNEQTAADNEFQSQSSLSSSAVLSAVIKEFECSVEMLKNNGLEVIVIDKQEDPALAEDKTPDAIFPNNWLSTNEKGQAFIFPMATENRRLETKQYALVERKLRENGFEIKEKIEIEGKNGQFLEGTGSMIFHKKKNAILAAVSLRTAPELLSKFAGINGETVVSFGCLSSNNKPIYHTNIVLCVGDGFATICLESIRNEEERLRVLECLGGLEIVEISLKQAEESLCGNMLHLRNKDGKGKIVLSERAYQGLNEEQRGKLGKFGDFVRLPIKLVEEIGGGSARCMLCEIFLQKK